jgi:hypothetical protein
MTSVDVPFVPFAEAIGDSEHTLTSKADARKGAFSHVLGRKYSVASRILFSVPDGDGAVAAPDRRRPRVRPSCPARTPAVPETDHRGTRSEP